MELTLFVDHQCNLRCKYCYNGEKFPRRMSLETMHKAVDLARGADLFFCEAAFLQRDADHARRKHHLTAAQAGELARAAGAARLEIFHFSPKYLDEEDLLLREALAAHHGTAAVDSDSAVP